VQSRPNFRSSFLILSYRHNCSQPFIFFEQKSEDIKQRALLRMLHVHHHLPVYFITYLRHDTTWEMEALFLSFLSWGLDEDGGRRLANSTYFGDHWFQISFGSPYSLPPRFSPDTLNLFPTPTCPLLSNIHFPATILTLTRSTACVPLPWKRQQSASTQLHAYSKARFFKEAF